MNEDTSVPDRREGRGWLSTIDQLPPEADNDVAWAIEQLRETRLPQTTILEEFNLRLADKGIPPVSRGAFNRYSVRKAIQFRKLDEVRRMASDLVQSLGTDGPDHVTVTVAEMLKTAMYQTLEGGELSPKDLMELGRALQSAVNAQSNSEEYRKKLEARANKQIQAAAKRVEVLARDAGLSSDAVAQLRREFLGVKADDGKTQ
jgi:hypothetical protein